MRTKKRVWARERGRVVGILFLYLALQLFAIVLAHGSGQIEDNRLKRGRNLISRNPNSRSSSGRAFRTENQNTSPFVAPPAPTTNSRTPAPPSKPKKNPALSANSILRRGSSSTRWDEASSICHTVPGLTREQVELCIKTPDAAKVAVDGIQLAVAECAHQMQKHRWNCSTLQGSTNPHNTQLLQKGYRESAFGHAISAAGVAFAVAKACSQGKLLSCGCGFQYDDQVNYYPSKETDYVYNESNDAIMKRGKTDISRSSWKWSGCSHNMGYGMKFAKKFLDSREKSSDLPSRINLHNNRVGRMAVSSNMEVRCKCHGLSGSCELRTCWRSAPDFRTVGTELKNKFRRAVMIDQTGFGNRPFLLNRGGNGKSSLNRQQRRKRRDRQGGQNKNTKIDLWYYERSPTYCESNPDFDFPGTSGRRCNRTEGGSGSCSTLCCGRGYSTIRQVYTTRCNCLFRWCCEVICQNCTVDEWITVCK